MALRGGVATRLCEVVVRRDIDGGSRMVWMEGGTTLGAKEGGGGEAPTQTSGGGHLSNRPTACCRSGLMDNSCMDRGVEGPALSPT